MNDLKAQLDTLTEELEGEQVRLQIESTRRQLDYIREGREHIAESWYEVPSDTGEFSRTDYGFAPRDLRFPYTRIYDRQEGRQLPYFDTEQDLQRIRAKCRNVSAFSSTAWGAMTVLQSYNIGTGYDYEATPAEGHEQFAGLAKMVQAVVDEFIDENSFSPSTANVKGNTSPPLENELDKRSREDGEAFLLVYDDGKGESRVRFVEPDQITEPGVKQSGRINDKLTSQLQRDIEDYANTPPLCNWRFGVATPYNATLRAYENDRPVGYHVLHDEVSGDFDFVPASLRGESTVMVHARRNVNRNTKRGIPDFFPITEKLEKLEKLSERLVDGAAIQASIAFIRSWGKASPATLGGGPTSTNADVTSWTSPKESGEGSRTVPRRVFHSGEIVDLYGEQAAYHAGPMGQLRSPIFIEVAQFVMRLISRIWTIPEDVISGDASNNNLASIQEAHSPFRKARDKDQADNAGVLLCVVWRAVEIAFKSGRFGNIADGLSWKQFCRVIQITATAPDVVVRDTLSQAQENQIWLQSGVKSTATVQRELGLDPDEERQQGARSGIDAASGIDATKMAAFEAVYESCDTLEERRSLLRDI